jgi:hypothetical protein
MKRTSTITAVAACIGAGILVFMLARVDAQMHQRGMMHGGAHPRAGMYTDSMHAMPMGPMGCGAMMGKAMMRPRQIVAVKNGIIVSMGNKLIKYDSDLNKKKEVTLEFDADDMKTMYEHMEKMHSLYKEMHSPSSEKE